MLDPPLFTTICENDKGKVKVDALTPAEDARLSDPGKMQRYVDLVGWLHTEMVTIPARSRSPIQVLTGPVVG